MSRMIEFPHKDKTCLVDIDSVTCVFPIGENQINVYFATEQHDSILLDISYECYKSLLEMINGHPVINACYSNNTVTIAENSSEKKKKPSSKK